MRSIIAVTLLLSLAGCNKQASDEATKTAEKVLPMNAAQTAYAKANEAMHKGMTAIPADADVAFMQGMITHHQGAVDMAKVVLEHGKDAKTREMASTIIETQTAEIKAMQAWLKTRKVELTAADHAAMGH